MILREALARRRVWQASGDETELRSNVSADEARSLHRAVFALKPAVSAEVGLAQGVSTLAILQALATANVGVHHVIDPFQAHYSDAGLAMISRAGLEERFRFHRRFAEEVIPFLPPLQFGFIDSSHLFDLTLVEFVLLDKKLERGGVLALHDMWMPSQQAVLRYVLKNRAYEIVRDFDAPDDPVSNSPRSRLESLLRSLSRRVPRLRSCLHEELLHPWREFGVGNLVFLRKTDHDRRDWTFHHVF